MPLPRCFGLLMSPTSRDCRMCLVQAKCSEAMLETKPASGELPKAAIPPTQVPKDKKSLILAVCDKHGISKVLRSKDGEEREVTAENMHEYYNIECLLTTKAALTQLLTGR